MARATRNAPPQYKPWLKAFDTLTYTQDASRTFADFCECAALAISNRADASQFHEREARYLSIITSYKKKEDRMMFGTLFAMLVELFDRDRFADHLGVLFGALEIGNQNLGQFFTPYEVCRLMAKLTITDAADILAKNDMITICEPCCGAGSQCIATAEVFDEQQIDLGQSVHFTAIDLDARCVAMTYVQLSMIGAAAIVMQGNSLTQEMTGIWRTPMHVRHDWERRRFIGSQGEPALAIAAE